MHIIDWTIVAVYLVWVLWDGLRRSKNTDGIEGYFLANRSLPWWAVGLSVMATQLSAVTMIGTTGQGATDGMRFVQFYFGLPLAMVILGVTLVPFLHGARVFTVYEFLERRFDAKTRALTSFLFLVSRSLACGTIIAAPGIVFSAIFGWDMIWSVALLGVPTVLYTMVGGVQAVTWVDVKQMVLIVSALVIIVVVLFVRIPVSPDAALRLAGATNRLRVFDFTFTLENQYTFWSGIVAGTFLMLSYFGTDQSQAQRYLTAKSIDEARSSLLMSAYWKIPLQALILLIGVLVFVFYLFVKPPMLFNPANDRAVRDREPAVYAELDRRYSGAIAVREGAARVMAKAPDDATAAALFRASNAATDSIRREALSLVEKATGRKQSDVNYVMPRFVLDHLPIGLIGIFIAAVMAAAMSSIAAELNSLSTATVIDFYRRWVRAEAPESHFLAVSKIATLVWGLVACGVAVRAATLGSLIEVVNRYGSFFYGSILGVFLLAMIPWTVGTGAFIGLFAGMGAVWATATYAPQVAFLWHNVIGAVMVVVVGSVVSLVAPGRRRLSP